MTHRNDRYGVIVVGTSNRAPHELYQGHFNDTHFSPWVEMMDDKWTVRHLDSHNDYRRAMGTTEDTAATAPFRPVTTPSRPPTTMTHHYDSSL